MAYTYQERIRRASELGVCPQCFKKPPQKGKKKCHECLRYHVEYNRKNAAIIEPKKKLYRAKVRAEVIQKYGGCCACCGETTIQFLAIDHKNGDGAKERRERTGKNCGAGQTYSWYLQLRREPKRDDLRVLCHNCNAAIAFYGTCPHQRTQ